MHISHINLFSTLNVDISFLMIITLFILSKTTYIINHSLYITPFIHLGGSIPTFPSISTTRLCSASSFYAMVFVSVLSVRICPCRRCVSCCCVFRALSMSVRTRASSFCTDFLVSAIFMLRTVSSVSFSPRIIVTCDRWYLISVRMSESLFYNHKE